MLSSSGRSSGLQGCLRVLLLQTLHQLLWMHACQGICPRRPTIDVWSTCDPFGCSSPSRSSPSKFGGSRLVDCHGLGPGDKPGPNPKQRGGDIKCSKASLLSSTLLLALTSMSRVLQSTIEAVLQLLTNVGPSLHTNKGCKQLRPAHE